MLKETRNAYELEDGRICVELYDEQFKSWDACVVALNDDATSEIWKAIKESGNFISYQEWLNQNAERLTAENARYALMQEIEVLKSELMKTDYQAIKYAEGELSAEEYSEVRDKRKFWRTRINELEALL